MGMLRVRNGTTEEPASHSAGMEQGRLVGTRPPLGVCGEGGDVASQGMTHWKETIAWATARMVDVGGLGLKLKAKRPVTQTVIRGKTEGEN